MNTYKKGFVMGEDREKKQAITEDDVREFDAVLREYMQGKKSVDTKATENYEWWKQRHWNYIETQNRDKKAASAWLFNSIINKHADIMDSFPKPNILPRAKDDEQDAQILSKIIPVVLEQNKYQKVYSNTAYDLLITGGEIVGVFWDNDKLDGLGDIAIEQVDVHNLFWEPGIEDIQDSSYIFNVALVDDRKLAAAYPDVDIVTGKSIYTTEYAHDDAINTDNKSLVVDCYYKAMQEVPVIDDPQTGEWLTRSKTVLHMCKFCNGKLLFASENHKEYQDGFYEHGKYPFVVTPMFPVKDSPWGFGWVDVMKDPQMTVDALDSYITKVAMMTANPRWWKRKGCGINEDTLLDWSKPLIDFEGADIDSSLRQIEVKSIPSFVVNQKESKIDELKETSANRDFSQGGTAAGVTAASAIASMQEAGAKIPRDINRIKYASTEDVSYMVLELIRQFYTEDRTFRIDGQSGGHDFVTYNNEQINADSRRPVFDIKISAEKQSPFSRAAQNETAKEMYNMGWFNPQNATASLVAIDMMEFEGKDSIKTQIMQNDMMMKQFNAMAQTIMQLDSQLPGIAASVGLESPAQSQDTGKGKAMKGTAEERAAKADSTEITQARNARVKAAKQAVPE